MTKWQTDDGDDGTKSRCCWCVVNMVDNDKEEEKDLIQDEQIKSNSYQWAEFYEYEQMAN